jgi:succinyl-diaminopimelate desuccinylase
MDSIKLAEKLIRFKSISPSSEGSLEYLEQLLKNHKFECHLLEFGEQKVKNLYAVFNGGSGPNVCFAGHTDVVPPGDLKSWNSDPFTAVEKNGRIYGRGAADMKSAIAAYVCAVIKFLKDKNSKFNGSISFLLTADEEGEAFFGTKKVVEWLEMKKIELDFCLVGEPTNPVKLGEMLKIGRRGSLNGVIIVNGKQGHVAYPHLAKNPIDGILKICDQLKIPLDKGSKAFQPSNLVITSIDVDNKITNLIPNKASIRFNIRFNDNFNSKDLIKILHDRLKKTGEDYNLEVKVSGESFFNFSEKLTKAVVTSIKEVRKITPELSTTGGTSDARFISKLCPVIEFGLIGETMHQINENVEIKDIKDLYKIYFNFIENIFNDKFF